VVKQRVMFESGNELAAYAAKQINYHVMGYYPITPSTQIAEQLDVYKAEGGHDTTLMPAEGEHSAAGICYGAAAGGGRVFNATSANGLLYALEQLPVQSGTRFPMVLNVACRTVSGPLDIKGDHSDIMYTLNTGWIILFANDPQAVYDFNICALKIAERAMLPAIVAFDGFFTSHQKRKCEVIEDDAEVKRFLGDYKPEFTALDVENPVTIGSYMNEPDLINNKYRLHLAMEKSRGIIDEVFAEYAAFTGRSYSQTAGYMTEDAEVVLFLLGSSYHTAKTAVDKLRGEGAKVGVFTANILRPFPADMLYTHCKNAKTIIIGDRQDSYGAGGGNMTLEIKAMLQEKACTARVLSRIYGLGGLDFYVEDAISLLREGFGGDAPDFDYIGKYPGNPESELITYFNPVTQEEATPKLTETSFDEEANKLIVKGVRVNESTRMPMRIAPGHGACPGCGIPVNVNLLLKGIEGNVVLLFQTGCGMVVTTGYPKTAFRVPYIHNLFQNGAATLSGLVEVYSRLVSRGEMPDRDITFVMVSGDGGMDIGMGSALGTAIRNNGLIIFEYDNGGYMNTGYQLSYSTPKGAKSSTSHVGKHQAGKDFFHKDMPMIMAGTHLPYLATVAESNPSDFLRKAVKAKYYAQNRGTVYMRALSACPLNWGDKPERERQVIEAGVDCCYFPLFEIENGITTITYNPEEKNKKIPVTDWLKMMGRTKHLADERYSELVKNIQDETDRRWTRLKALHDSPVL
jgi:pyruvate ferredoxin oxidoreductase alpha subunit